MKLLVFFLSSELEMPIQMLARRNRCTIFIGCLIFDQKDAICTLIFEISVRISDGWRTKLKFWRPPVAGAKSLKKLCFSGQPVYQI